VIVRLIVAVSLLAPLSLEAQTSAEGPVVLSLPSSARAAAFGNAYPLASGSADVVFYHPALLDGVSGVAASWSASAETGSLSSVAGATEWFGGDIGLSVRTARYRTGAPGSAGLARVEADLRAGGLQGVSETVVTLTHARELGPVLLGASAHLVDLSALAGYDRGAAFDLGAALDIGFGNLALSARSLGGDLDLGSDAVRLPTTLSLGLGTRARPTGPFDLSAAASVDRLRAGDLRPGAGLEVAWWPIQGRTFAGRIGYGRPIDEDPAGGLTLGAAFRGDRISIEYAWGTVETDAPVHRFGLAWR